MTTGNELARKGMLEQRFLLQGDAEQLKAHCIHEQKRLAAAAAAQTERMDRLIQTEDTLKAIDQWLEQNGGPA